MNHKHKIKKLGRQIKKLRSLLFLLPILAVFALLSLVSPEQITHTLGTQNTYIAMFFIAFIGGVSVFSSVPYPLFLVTFALGGANPFVLAALSAIAVVAGDSVSYIAGRKGKVFLTGKNKKIFDYILRFYDLPRGYVSAIFFCYGCVSPLPNDLITLSSGLKNYPYRRMILPLTAGNFVFCLALAYFAEFFSSFFT